MTKTIENVLNGAGPAPALEAALQLVQNFGTMLRPQHFDKTQAAAAIVKFSALGMPPLRAGAICKAQAGTLAQFSAWFIGIGSFAVDVPAAGATYGSGNAAIRIVPRPGYTVRFAMFNPSSPGESTGPTIYNPSFTRRVYTSLKGKTCEIWVALSTTSMGVLVSPQLATSVIADLLASPDVVAACQTVDTGAGNGSSDVVALAPSTLDQFRPHFGAASADTGDDPAYYAPGTFVLSQDGDLGFFIAPWTQATFEYTAAPAFPLENEYPGA